MMVEVGPNQLEINGKIYNVSQIFFNGTSFNSTACTAETCSLLIGTYTYLPSLAGNAFFAAVFGILFLINVPLGLYHQTWGILVATALGLGLEVAAYISRIMIHNDDFVRNPFIVYLYCITLGPTFLSAAVYLCLGRIVVAYGEGNSRLKPRTYSLGFLFGDFIALALQAAGGGMAQVAEFENTGVHTMVAGLSFQVLSLTIFAAVCADFAWRVCHHEAALHPAFDVLRRSRKWTCFLWALAVITVAIQIRSVYRVLELQAGFHSSLFNNEVLFMLLEGTVITIGCVAFTAFHPGQVFGRQWREANFRFKDSKKYRDARSTSESGGDVDQEG